MPEINAPGAAAVGAPAAAGAAIADKVAADLPFSAASNSEWETKALETARAAADKKALHVLNGRRVTAWRICVEKKRREWAAIFGLPPGSLVEFPPDCKGKVLEFLAPVPSGGHPSPAEVHRLAQKREAEVVDKWTGVLLDRVRHEATKKAWFGTNFSKNAINRENVGDTMDVLGDGENWWEFEPLLERLRGLGYGVEKKAANEDGEYDDKVLGIDTAE